MFPPSRHCEFRWNSQEREQWIAVQAGSSALHASLSAGLVCSSLFLLMAGADPGLPGKDGHTAMYSIITQLLQVRAFFVF